MRTARLLALAAAFAAAAALPGAARAQGAMPSYEPQQRLRASGLDTCRKSEVMRGAHCFAKCQAGFRMDTSGARPRCVGLKADAKYAPPKPAYQPPPPDPARTPPPGA
jgi:hypothetical protein